MRDLRSVDVAIVGAGPAGLAAASEAAEAGASVLVLDQAAGLGGQIWRHRSSEGVPRRAARVVERFMRSGAEYKARITLVSAEQGHLALTTPDGPMRVRARAIILAMGARELFLPFPGWTIPNVFGVGGLQALIKSGLDVRGRRVVIAGTGPLLFPVAATAAGHGARLQYIAEQAPGARVARFAAGLWRSPSKIFDAVGYRASFMRVPFRAGTWVVRTEGTNFVERAVMTDGIRTWTIECDLVAAACGLVPNTEVAMAMGCSTTQRGIVVDDAQQTSVAGVFAAGECTGVGGEDLALVEGVIAGRAAVGKDTGPEHARRARLRGFASRMAVAFALRPELLARAAPDTVVCRCEDVRLGAVHADWGQRQTKLATRAGMGACQGRICGAAMERMFGVALPAPRSPLAPATAEVLRELADDP